jgi:hypothetical protein
MAYSLTGKDQGYWLQWKPQSPNGPAGMHILGTFFYGIDHWLDSAELWIPDDPESLGNWNSMGKNLSFAGTSTLTFEDPSGDADPNNPWQPKSRDYLLTHIREESGDTTRIYRIAPSVGIMAFETSVAGNLSQIAQAWDRLDFGKSFVDTLLK